MGIAPKHKNYFKELMAATANEGQSVTKKEDTQPTRVTSPTNFRTFIREHRTALIIAVGAVALTTLGALAAYAYSSTLVAPSALGTSQALAVLADSSHLICPEKAALIENIGHYLSTIAGRQVLPATGAACLSLATKAVLYSPVVSDMQAVAQQIQVEKAKELLDKLATKDAQLQQSVIKKFEEAVNNRIANGDESDNLVFAGRAIPKYTQFLEKTNIKLAQATARMDTSAIEAYTEDQQYYADFIATMRSWQIPGKCEIMREIAKEMSSL